MANLGQVFNANELPQGNSFEPLPAGWYAVTVTGAELKATNAGTGRYIAVKYTVMGPTAQGRVVFGNMNIVNPNPKAEEIGRQDLGDLMRAGGLQQVQDTDQLIGIQLEIKLTIKPDDVYGPKNEIKGYRSIGQSIPQAAPQAMPAQIPQVPAVPAYQAHQPVAMPPQAAPVAAPAAYQAPANQQVAPTMPQPTAPAQPVSMNVAPWAAQQ